MSKYTYNPFTEKLDNVSLDTTAANALYLKLDQTTHQHVINGAPRFDSGIFIGNDDTKFILNGNDFELWVNGTKAQTWTIAILTSKLLLETGDFLLLETGDKLLLEA